MLLGVNLAGAEFNPSGTRGVNSDYVYPSHSEIDYFASKGVHIIRLPFLWERLQPTMNGPLSKQELSYIDDVVSYANSKGIKVDLDLHDFGSGYGHLVGSADTPNSAFADLWEKIGAHFAGNANVMFGLMNEPHVQSASNWLVSANTAIAAIRASGATSQMILVSGSYWDGAWTWVSSDNDTVLGNGVHDPSHNFAFELHQYLDADGSGTHAGVVSESIGVERLTSVTQWAETTGNKLFLGEFGVASDATSLSALDGMLSYMKDHADVWLGGTYWAAGPWWGDYMFSVEPQNGVDKPQFDVLEKFISPDVTSVASGIIYNDSISGNESGNILQGTDGNDRLFGAGGDDILIGDSGTGSGAGSDMLDGGTGADQMWGGGGDDIYMVDNTADVVNERPGGGNDIVHTTVTYTLGANVDSLILDGTGDLSGAGNADNNAIYGNAGNNIIDGRGGADFMVGGDGNDIYFIDNTADRVLENPGPSAGNDIVHASIDYTIGDNVESLILDGAAINGAGNAEDNAIIGNAANNIIDGKAGADFMVGGEGNDIYFVDNAGDSIVEGSGPTSGNDIVHATIDYTIGANVESLVLDGAGNIDGAGNAEDNALIGNSGDNNLDGRAGQDFLVGNGGNDTFQFEAGEANGDLIADFDGNGAGAGDQLIFFGFGTIADGATFTQIGATNSWTIHSGLDAHDEVITFQNGASIDASDFHFLP